MERLVRASLDAGRPIVLVAAYDEQSRVTLRVEAEKATRPDVEQAFREANTVAWLLNKARFAPKFRESLRGGDIYVDEGSLLDNQTMLGLANLARDIDARVIFQGDTQQLQPVGRGQPLAMLERELGFGMHVGRINVTRRQLRLEDKRLAQELSSGDAVRFSTATEALIASGAILSGGTDEAVQTILANRNAQKPVDAIVLLSTHRLAERISEKLHVLTLYCRLIRNA
jgi:ATP-dependent exoDNAse (exonuclease V) alpha subunit